MKTTDQQFSPTVLGPERNSLILEHWLDSIPWEGKLAASLLVALLNSPPQDRLREIGQHVLNDFQQSIYETEGLTSESDLWAREIYFLLSDDHISDEAADLLESGQK